MIKNNSFSSHPPLHESICFFFCTAWRRFVYSRRSNLLNKALHVPLDSYPHWYCAAVFPFAIFSPIPASPKLWNSPKFLLCCLCCFLIKTVCGNMSLKDPIECVLKHMGKWPYTSSRNSDWQREDVSSNREVENLVVAYCYSALFI